MKIHVVEAELYNADGQTDREANKQGGRHDGAKSRFSQFCEKRLTILGDGRSQDCPHSY